MAVGKIAIIAVSERGAKLAAPLSVLLPGAEAFVLEKYAGAGQTPFTDTGALAASLWKTHTGIIFLCASGIAVRAIAPLVSSKYSDPAVVVCGDIGAFSISLLSGHEGGANALAEQSSVCINSIRLNGAPLGSVPVITTASEASPAVLPRNLFVGIGCKRGAASTAITDFVQKTFFDRNISPLRIRAICTIDIKRGEAGLEAAAEALGVPLLFFSAEELNAATGDFCPSEYVLKITGTDNVCERAAAAGSDGRLIVPKTASDGITLAVFERQ
ncbi:MAG: cobalamin biosynthesis protein [Spirochaetaceae bacterium]|jgi:cobalt-precorrin 5A hydrolase|nr:cobalamin biosynthesis protein [Spirochaetaceae bacterium]